MRAFAVWKELEKENKEFFETYKKDREERNIIEAETMERIQKMLSEAAASKSSDDDEG